MEPIAVILSRTSLWPEALLLYLGAGELPPDGPVDGALVGHQAAGAIDIGSDDRAQGLRGDVRNMEAAHPTITLGQSTEPETSERCGPFGWRLAADEGFVTFNDLVLSAKRVAVIADAEVGHGLANAMAEEPCGFHAGLESALKLAGADTLFRGTEQIDGLEPNPHGDVARLENRADLDSKGLTASVALAETNAVGFAP